MTRDPQTIPAELRFLAERVLSEARRELQNTGTCDVICMLQAPDGKTVKLPLPPNINEVMNSGPGKDIFFGLVRKVVKGVKPTAVLFATDAWLGMPTEKQGEILREGGREKLEAMLKDKSLDEVVDMGLVERKEAVVVTVQTATQVLIVHQFYERNERAKRIDFTERDEFLSVQANFAGRQKMYGRESKV